MFPSRLFLVLLAAAALWPAAAHAQRISVAGQPWTDRFALEPYAGVYFDNTGRAGAEFDQSGFLGGVRVLYLLADRARLIGDAGYSRGGEVTIAAPGGGRPTFRSDSWLATGGLELDLVPGETGGTVGVQAGTAWRTDLDGDGYSRSAVLVPGFAFRQQLAPRADLKLGVQDYILLRESPVSHNLALTAGVAIR